jgi:hypothetical protein
MQPSAAYFRNEIAKDRIPIGATEEASCWSME